jgi:hypothetical protein
MHKFDGLKVKSPSEMEQAIDYGYWDLNYCSVNAAAVYKLEVDGLTVLVRGKVQDLIEWFDYRHSRTTLLILGTYTAHRP